MNLLLRFNDVWQTNVPILAPPAGLECQRMEIIRGKLLASIHGFQRHNFRYASRHI